MINVSQAVQTLSSTGPASSVQLSRTALLGASFPPLSTARQSAGTVPQDAVLYTSAGALMPATGDPQPTTMPVEQVALSSVAAPLESAAAVPVANGLPSVAAAQINAEPAVVPLPSIGNVPAANAFIDPAVRALADFTANPVHGNLATALYINAASFRTRQASSAVLVSAVDLPGPVSSLNAINVDVADLTEQAPNRRGLPRFLRPEGIDEE